MAVVFLLGNKNVVVVVYSVVIVSVGVVYSGVNGGAGVVVGRLVSAPHLIRALFLAICIPLWPQRTTFQCLCPARHPHLTHLRLVQ